MPITPQIITSVSNAPVIAPTSSVMAPRRPTDPRKVISPIDTINSTILQYPIDRPKYYMNFDIYNYKRSSLLSIGKLERASRVSQIILPLPPTLNDINTLQWTDRQELGMLIPGLVQAIGTTVASVANAVGKPSPVGSGDVIGAPPGTPTVSVPMDNGLPGLPSANTIGQVVGSQVPIVSSLLGISPNQFMTVLFVGPNYKRHRFSWAISPHNKQESDIIRKIDKTFKNAMSPKLIAGGFVWDFPKIFWISMMPNSKWLYKFKPAVLENYSINYTPGGRPAFYMDKNNGNENAPEGLIINLSFIELEFWLEGNFNDSNDPFDVYTQNPNYQAPFTP